MRSFSGFFIMITALVIAFQMDFARASEKTAPQATKSSESQRRTQGKATKKSKTTKSKAATSSLSRDVVFDGTQVNGRYHSSGEAVTTVEQEKTLNNLIGWRKNFKDRLAAERARLAREQGQ